MLRSAPAPLTLALLLLAACGDGGSAAEDAGTTTPPADTGVEEPADTGVEEVDAGPVDTGVPRDCSANPFQCAPDQEMNADCVCLESCAGGLRWNPATSMCEEPPAGECGVNSDCNLGEVCLDVLSTGGLGECTGAASCRCFFECDPWVLQAQTGCPPDDDFGTGRVPVTCTWLGPTAAPPQGLCLPTGSGGEQGATCSDLVRCNANKNFACYGPQNGPGECARWCDTTRPPVVCEALGDYICFPLEQPDLPDKGLCFSTPADDIATTCTSSVTCQGNYCSQALGGTCTQPCGLTRPCADDSVCVNGVEAEAVCTRLCSGPDAAGDAECAALHPSNHCRALLTDGRSICFP
ncbi:MAG: hypothetical protein H6730_12455 [Deltaproteobacteria bacterium]|nr:hypothetical protein [Deltaproteobacteria bacterium]